MCPISFLFTPKYEDWSSKGITLYFSAYRKEFGLLLGEREKKKKKKKETQAWWKIKLSKYTVGRQNIKMQLRYMVLNSKTI